jgi:transposase InsO family protein
VDSGATNHCISEEKYFFESRLLDVPIEINTFKKDANVLATKIGTLLCVNPENGVEFRISDVLFSKDFPGNLLSVKSLAKSNVETSFDINYNVTCRRVADGEIVLQGSAVSTNLYRTKLIIKYSSNVNVFSAEINDKLWHYRLCHINYQTLKKMSDRKLINKISNSHFCDPCVRGKLCKLPHRTQIDYAPHPLQLVHTDVAGPMQTISYDSKRYILTFIDQFTSFVVVYLLERKDQVFSYFRDYEAKAKARFNRSIVELRLDNGSEYFNNMFQDYCSSNGIVMGPTVVDCKQSNGKAERFNRTIVELARTLLMHSNLDKIYWSEAVLCATFTLNRVLNYKNKLPAELWYGKSVDYRRFFIFGCEAYQLIYKNKSNLLNSSSG